MSILKYNATTTYINRSLNGAIICNNTALMRYHMGERLFTHLWVLLKCVLRATGDLRFQNLGYILVYTKCISFSANQAISSTSFWVRPLWFWAFQLKCYYNNYAYNRNYHDSIDRVFFDCKMFHLLLFFALFCLSLSRVLILF